MAGRTGNKHLGRTSTRRFGLVVGGAVSAFVAAAAMATGSAAPAKADFEDLLDPIIQPFLTSLTDSIAVVDPAAALDLTSWTDSLLASLNTSFDFTLPSVAEPAAAVAAAAEPAAATGGTLPLTVLEGTEPAVYATIDGGSTSVPLLVDTGSSGLVIPYTDLGDNWLTQLENLFQLGFPSTFGLSGYSGGVEYLYGVYNNVPVDYLETGGGTLATNGPVDVELFSWSNNLSDPFENFQSFLTSNQVDGILGIGENAAGPTASPFENYGGVLVDIPHGHLVVGGDNPLTGGTLLQGAPIVNGLTEKVTDASGATIGSTTVSNDLDSGGVYGTIPSSIVGSGLAAGDKISVYDGNTLLYSYVIGTDSLQQSTAPTVISGTSIDSGVVPFLNHEAYIDYANDTLYWGPLVT